MVAHQYPKIEFNTKINYNTGCESPNLDFELIVNGIKYLGSPSAKSTAFFGSNCVHFNTYTLVPKDRYNPSITGLIGILKLPQSFTSPVFKFTETPFIVVDCFLGSGTLTCLNQYGDVSFLRLSTDSFRADPLCISTDYEIRVTSTCETDLGIIMYSNPPFELIQVDYDQSLFCQTKPCK